MNREALRRIEQAAAEGWEELDLAGLELTELPPEIGQLWQLKRLILGKWDKEKSEWVGNQLTTLPLELGHLQPLEVLDLGGNQLTTLPDVIGQLKSLQSLDFRVNQLTTLPDAIAQLTNLQSLYLGGNQLTMLPDAICELRSLQSLYLSNNQLTTLPDAICELRSLQSLDLCTNQLTMLPDADSWCAAIGQLTNLQSLNLSENQLTMLPEVICQLTSLQSLNLHSSQLTTLPDEIAQLRSLQSLGLSNNNLTPLPQAIGQLHYLQKLVLNINQLTTLPDAIGQLTSLQSLDLNGNQLTTLPDAIGQLTSLQSLGLSVNQLTTLPDEIGQLTALQTLNLGSNRLTTLPDVIAQLTKLQTLTLGGNPLEPDLAAAYDQGLGAMMQYLRAKAEGEISLHEAKLILVGEGEVGKSCLLGALRGDPWVEGRPTTHGIEIKPVIVTVPDSDTEITLNGWDFGGQRVYRPTHQLFFSAPAVYLVVWKPREGPQQGFVKEWISLIKHREPAAKILVVATHGGPGQRQPDIDRQELLDLFGSDTVVDFFYVDSKPDPATQHGTGIAALRAAIATVAAALPEMGRAVPAKWQRARETLQTCEQPYLPYAEVMRLCADQGIDAAQAQLFIQISHRLGHFTHYHHDPTLRDIVILKPDWLAKAISFVLDDATTRRRQGLVDFAHLSQIWSQPPFLDERGDPEPGYPVDLHPVFLRLMERFDLSYKVVLDPTQPSTTSLIAQLVPDNRPDSLPAWGDQPENEDRQQVQICRIVDDRGDSANAEGLFYQLIVRLHKYSLGRNNYEHSIHWQRGLMLDNDYNGRALLEHTGTDVKITVRAAYPERFLSYLTEEVKWLVEHFWEGLRCNVMVPCISPCGMNAPGHGLFEVQKLIESKRKQRPAYPCPISGCDEWQTIDQLLYNAPIAQPALPSGSDAKILTAIQGIRQDLRIKDQRDHLRYQNLSKQQQAAMSQADQQFAGLMQMLTDEAKEGPRLFSFKPVEPGFFDRPTWISAKFQITLWCEHARQPLPVLNPDNPQAGVYHLDLPRKWLVKAAPLLKIMSVTLGLILPVASATTKVILDDATYKNIGEQLELGQKSVEFALKGSDLAVDWQAKAEKSHLEHGESLRVEGSLLRELHVLLKKKDPGFGGLVRVQNKRREFLWVHPQFVDEY